MKAALYARFSTERQSDASIEDQFRVCERIAEREGLEIVVRFSDAAISAGTANRPGYQQMLAAARRHHFDVIVTEDISRLWRNRAEFGPRSAELEDLGVHLVTAVGDDTRRDGWGLTIQLKQMIAEAARRETGYRTARGLEGKARAGKPTGGRAYGYTAAKDSGTGQLEINEAQADIVRRIFEQFAQGRSYRSIASSLNEEGVPSPSSTWKGMKVRFSGWTPSTLFGDFRRGTGILNNVRYVGVVQWGREKYTRGAADSKRRRRSTNAKPAHEYLDERLRIVPQELWDKVKARQRALRVSDAKTALGDGRHRRRGAGRPPMFPLSGLLFCGVCGCNYVIRNKTHYCCGGRWNSGSCDNGIHLARDYAHERIVTQIRDDLRRPELIEAVEHELDIRTKLLLKGRPRSDDAKVGKRIAALKAEIANLTDAIARGMLRASPALAERLSAAESELVSLSAVKAPRTEVIRAVPNFRAHVTTVLEGLEGILTGDPVRGREALRQAVGESRIKLTPDDHERYLWGECRLGLVPMVRDEEIVEARTGVFNFLSRFPLRRSA